MKPNLIIPMAGEGSRFTAAGYTDPKPLIEFLGKRMIEHVVDAFHVPCNLIFIIREEHDEKYGVKSFLTSKWPGCQIISVKEKTEGAACTVLLAKHLINNDTPLYIMNSDNIVRWREPAHIEDGFIVTFEDTDPKWSFAKLDENGYVSYVAEKNPISTHATSGIYYWTRGSSFIQAAEEMIKANYRVNGEFYVAPVYNSAIIHKEKFTIVDSVMYGVGTPEDLERYIKTFK